MGGFDRSAKSDTRQRRMLQRMQAGTAGVEYGAGLVFDDTATVLSVQITATSGLLFTGSALAIRLDANPGLQTLAGGLSVLLAANPGLQRTAGGLSLLLDATPGLQSLAGGLSLLLDATPGLQTLAGGLSVLLAANPGLQRTAGGLSLLLDATPGLQSLAGGLSVLLAANPGLQRAAGGLSVLLAANPGLQRTAGGLSLLLDGSSLTLGALGVSVTTPSGQWTVGAVRTGLYTAVVGEVVRCDPTGAGFTVNLPTAVGIAGQQIIIKNVTTSVNVITIDASGAETIDGALTATIAASRGVVRILSDGAGWLIV